MSFFDDSSFFSASSSFGGAAGGGFGSSPPSSQFFESSHSRHPHDSEFSSPSLFSSSSSFLPSSQTQKSSSTSSSHPLKTPLGCAEGLLPVTVSMLQTAALQMQASSRRKEEEEEESFMDAERKINLSSEHRGEERERKEEEGGHNKSKKFQIHGNDVGLVCLRGWVSPPGCEKLASLIRFRFSDGTSLQDIEVEYDLMNSKEWIDACEEEEEDTSCCVLLPSSSFQKDSRETSADLIKKEEEEERDDEEGETGEKKNKKKQEQQKEREERMSLTGKTRFLQAGSLVKVIGGISTDLDGVVSISASVCTPIRNPLEFTLTHPAAVAYAAALFSSRRRRACLENERGKEEEEREEGEIKIKKEGLGETDEGGMKKKSKIQEEEQEKTTEEGLEPLSEEEEYQLLVDYGHIEDPVQRQVILFLLTRGGQAKRTSRAKILKEGCECAGKPKCSSEQIEEALRELEESAEIVEHAGFIALAC
ncbi:hypothetical protein CSUI_010127 [Cystoisospora suis]|uniref:Uncharacterized protein n=1 Tax=Cystoisospora suis TaxID=483139 RepID=A0A2C6JD81_9APIC|nr:hypothetical protein CSUI_010127 [Cystoisospora suis]